VKAGQHSTHAHVRSKSDRARRSEIAAFPEEVTSSETS